MVPPWRTPTSQVENPVTKLYHPLPQFQTSAFLQCWPVYTLIVTVGKSLSLTLAAFCRERDVNGECACMHDPLWTWPCMSKPGTALSASKFWCRLRALELSITASYVAYSNCLVLEPPDQCAWDGLISGVNFYCSATIIWWLEYSAWMVAAFQGSRLAGVMYGTMFYWHPEDWHLPPVFTCETLCITMLTDNSSRAGLTASYSLMRSSIPASTPALDLLMTFIVTIYTWHLSLHY